MCTMILAGAIIGVIVYFAFGSYKAKSSEEVALNKPADFNSKQKLTLAIIGLVSRTDRVL